MLQHTTKAAQKGTYHLAMRLMLLVLLQKHMMNQFILSF
jgi:hypothetical protein